jgi:hypothetical protein
MREVHATDQHPDPGRVFYTIRPEDVGSAVIHTDAGPIYMVNVLGRIMKRDVGKRLYRTPTDDGGSWYWSAENDEQRDNRLARSQTVSSG